MVDNLGDDMSAISWVSTVEGCLLSGVPLYDIEQNTQQSLMHLLATVFWCVCSSSSDPDSKKLEWVASRGFLGTLGPSKREGREGKDGEGRGEGEEEGR